MIKNFARLTALIAALSACSQTELPTAPKLAPEIMSARLADLDGRPASLDGLRGRPLVINFWAPWCDPCRREIPDLVAERQRLRPRGLEVVGIVLESDAAATRAFAAAAGIDYPVLSAGDQGFALLQAAGNSSGGLPYTIVVDRQGNVLARKLGALSRPEMATTFESALD